MEIKIPKDCRDCRFHLDSEDDEDWCCLLQKSLEKKEDCETVTKSDKCIYQSFTLRE